MKKTVFDNIRWGEITTGLMGLSGFLTALVQSPIPAQYKPWVMVAISAVAFLLAFLRNPKSLDWVDEAQDVAKAIQTAQTTASGVVLPPGIDATGPADDVHVDAVTTAVSAALPPAIVAMAPELPGNIVKEVGRVLRRGIRF